MTQTTESEIRYAMYKRNMRQTDLAKIMGISDAYLSDLLAGKRTGKKAREKIDEIKVILGI